MTKKKVIAFVIFSFLFSIAIIGFAIYKISNKHSKTSEETSKTSDETSDETPKTSDNLPWKLRDIKLIKTDNNQINKYILKSKFKDREFYISKPNIKTGKKYPIILLFHGGGEKAFDKKGKGVLNYTKFFKTNSICIVPKGQKSNNGHSWLNAYPWLKNNPKNDVEFVEYIIQTLRNSKYSKFIDFNSIFASGKSDGAGFCLYLHQNSNNINLKKIGICSGAYFTKNSVNVNNKKINMKKIPILEIHGTKDQVMPYEGQHFKNKKATRDAEYWKEKDSTLQNTYTFDIYNYWNYIAKNINNSVKMKKTNFKGESYKYKFIDKDNKTVLIHIKVIGQNHCWSGHDKSGPDSHAHQNHYFDATDEICKFFKITYNNK